MSFSNLSNTPPSSESREEPSAEYAAEQPTNTSPPHVTVNEESHASVQAGNRSAEFTTMGQISKIMCVTTNGALMVIAWAITAMTYSWLSAYWLYATVPAYRYHQYLVTYSYPMGVALVISLLFFPALAVIGDVRCGNLKLMLIIMIPMNIAGLLSYGGLSFLSALVHAKMISYLFVISYLLLFFAGGIFLTNAIQLGRDFLSDANSPERGAFVHWYFWATYVPTPAYGVYLLAVYTITSGVALLVVLPILLLGLISLLIFLLATCIKFHTRYRRDWDTVFPRIPGNPVQQVFKTTRCAIQTPSGPGHHSFFARLNKIRQSNDGPVDDQEVDNVGSFWCIVLLMVSLFGFFFYDDMWAMPFANGFTEESSSILSVLSSRITTSLVVVIGIPIYQFVIRPFTYRHPLLLWKIAAGLILQLISLAVVTWNVAETPISARSVACSQITNSTGTAMSDVVVDEDGIGWFYLAIPQLINAFSQLLLFPAVTELILTDASRVMHGLLIGLWYAMQSIHIIVGIIETATCAVFYWEYYTMKIALVLLSIIAFTIMSFFYSHRCPLVHNVYVTPARNEVGTYVPLEEVHNPEETKSAAFFM